MRYNIELKGFEQEDGSADERQVRKLIEREISAHNKRVEAFPPDSIFLRVLVERISAHRVYHLSVTFEMPGKTLPAKEQGSHIAATISAGLPRSSANARCFAPADDECANGNGSQVAGSFNEERRPYDALRRQ